VSNGNGNGDNGNSGWTTERFIAIIGAIFAGLSLLISTWNNSKLHTVEDRQVMNSQKIDFGLENQAEVKKDLAVQNAAVEKTAEKMNEVHKAVKAKGGDK
jgi:hypothetical protein